MKIGVTGWGVIGYPTVTPEQRAAMSRTERIRDAAPELLEALKMADRLITKLATTINNTAIEDHIPFGLTAEANEWLRSGANAVISKAEGRS